MAHEHGELTVSREVSRAASRPFLLHAETLIANHYPDRSKEAQRLEAQTTARLLSAQKLSLIVDLDQTIIHATVDRSVQDWLDNAGHPNHSALVGTKRFQLGAVLGEAQDPYWYYVKPRCAPFPLSHRTCINLIAIDAGLTTSVSMRILDQD